MRELPGIHAQTGRRGSTEDDISTVVLASGVLQRIVSFGRVVSPLAREMLRAFI